MLEKGLVKLHLGPKERVSERCSKELVSEESSEDGGAYEEKSEPRSESRPPQVRIINETDPTISFRSMLERAKEAILAVLILFYCTVLCGTNVTCKSPLFGLLFNCFCNGNIKNVWFAKATLVTAAYKEVGASKKIPSEPSTDVKSETDEISSVNSLSPSSRPLSSVFPSSSLELSDSVSRSSYERRC